MTGIQHPYQAKAIGAVVLAAGQSRRMGQPKMVLPWGSSTVIGRVVDILLKAGVAHVVVVTGAACEQVEMVLRTFPVRIVHNPHYANSSMVRSLQTGLRAFGLDVNASLVVLGDQPQIQQETVLELIAEHYRYPDQLIIPSFRQRRGHPWLIPRSLWLAVMDISLDQTLRNFIQDNSDRIHYLSVESNSILRDLDTQADYERERPVD